MKLVKYIYGMLAALALMLSASACSDNLDKDLSPTAAERYLKVDDHEGEFTLNLNADHDTITVDVESNTLWKVAVTKSEGGWCTVNKVSGRGNDSFSIIFTDNMSEARDGSVTVYMTNADGEILSDAGVKIVLKQQEGSVRISPSSLPQFAPQGNSRQEISITSTVAWTLNVTYEGADMEKFVTVIPDSETMKDEGNGTFSGNGDASFYISVSDNRTSADRKAFINLRSDVGNYQVEVFQIKPEYNFRVSPSEDIIVNVEGGSKEFTVVSLSDGDDGFDVTCNEKWVKLSTTPAKDGSSGTMVTVATFAPNDSAQQRKATIYFRPKDTKYETMEVNVTQMAYDGVFSVSRTDSEGIVKEDGATLQFEIDSRFDWQISVPSWMTVDTKSGSASSSIRSVKVEIAPNRTNENRSGTLTVEPLPTKSQGGTMTFDPSAFGIQPYHYEVIQAGGRDAAVSVIWLDDDYGKQDETVLEFNFYSPFRPVAKAGLKWRKESETDTEWQSMETTPSDPTDATVSFLLKGLEPATKYVAYGYVRYAEGGEKEGAMGFPFTTAGKYPLNEDNPTPSRR